MHIYFLGICGTAMGNAALLMRSLGHTISGADTGAYPPMSTALHTAGVRVLEGWDAARLSALAPDLVVIGNATSRGNPEIEELLETRRTPCVSLPELLRTQLLNRRRNLVVGGTHGKTTTTCLAAMLLRAAGADTGWLVGGIPRDLPSGAAAGVDGGPFVIEGDEYDSAFFDKRGKLIQYLPTVLALNNAEFDHADIFRDLDDVLRTFAHATRVVPRNGAIVANGDDAALARILADVTWCPVIRVGTGPDNDARITHFAEGADGARFTLAWRGTPWGSIHWAPPGLFNARNAAIAATAAATLLHPATPAALPLAALAAFQGVRRRQEQLLDTPALTVLEDFAHHPTALALTLASLRQRHPRHHIHAAFEPRSNTTTRSLMQSALVDALAHADSIWLAPVHSAQKLPPGERLDTHAMARELGLRGRRAHAADSHEALLDALRKATTTAAATQTPQLVVFFTNGAFGGIIPRFATAPQT
ncbi:MAG: Mur ligase domain-containing protein [Puniceicoccales bacterium]|jgi:UDP-N-acetylmuramate: L-alanyl-gamma-D-glutamyl-meso-diaminopimelate ligase|nr:Mur ligase domain-containing protein [Puniceicoccales bacterium]